MNRTERSHFSPIAVANEFISEFGATAPDLTHLKLQKLAYFSNGWWLATQGDPLLNEKPQVWRYGPVFESLYHILSRYGDMPIKRPTGATLFDDSNPRVGGDRASEVRNLVKWIWTEYGSRSAAQLSELTHQVGTPWRNIASRRNFHVPMNTVIPPEEDWKYFARLASQRAIRTRPLTSSAA